MEHSFWISCWKKNFLYVQRISDDSKTLEESSDSEEDMDGNDTSDNTHGNNTKKVKLM